MEARGFELCRHVENTLLTQNIRRTIRTKRPNSGSAPRIAHTVLDSLFVDLGVAPHLPPQQKIAVAAS